jgi:hypothetical protein
VGNAGDSVQGEGYSDLRFLSQLLVGLAYVGSDELRSRLRLIGPSVAADIEAHVDTIPDDETLGAMLSYLALGAMLRGQRRMARRVRRGIDLSRHVAGWALGTVDRLMRNPLTRPVHESVERRLWAAMLEGQQAIVEGRREANTARMLATRTAEEIVDDLLDSVIANPQLVASMQDMVRQQSTGLTMTVVSNTRQLTVSADDIAEGMVRRLLRRGPRPPLSSLPGGVREAPGMTSDDT